MALSPPAVFSISMGSGRSTRSIALRQLAYPSLRPVPAVTCPPCTTRPLAPIAAAASRCWLSSLRLGIRIRLFAVATLMP